MRIACSLAALVLCGCYLREYARGKAAFEEGRYSDAAGHFERALADPAMDWPRRIHAAGLLLEAHLRRGDPGAARRALERGADLLLADYRLLDLTPEQAAKVHRLHRFRYHWRLALRAARHVSKLPDEARELARRHFELASAWGPFPKVWEAEFLLDRLTYLPSEDLRARLLALLEELERDPATAAEAARIRSALPPR